MRAFVGISSGQDSALVLYKMLTETDHEVYAINVQHRKIYSRNDIRYHQFYRENVVNWLKDNCRDFVYDSVIGKPSRWSPRWEGEKDYSEITTEKLDEWRNKYATEYYIKVLEQWYAIAKAAQELECDIIFGGNDIVQVKNVSGTTGIELVNMITGIPVVFPLKDLGRIGIYHELSKGLKQRFAPCENFGKFKLESMEPCGKCRKCITTKAYKKLYLTGKYTIEELDKVYYDSYMNTETNIKQDGATKAGLKGIEKLLDT